MRSIIPLRHLSYPLDDQILGWFFSLALHFPGFSPHRRQWAREKDLARSVRSIGTMVWWTVDVEATPRVSRRENPEQDCRSEHSAWFDHEDHRRCSACDVAQRPERQCRNVLPDKHCWIYSIAHPSESCHLGKRSFSCWNDPLDVSVPLNYILNRSAWRLD